MFCEAQCLTFWWSGCPAAGAGAPADLVQVVTGYGEAGGALVTAPVDKLIFVGSVEVGRKVMAAASAALTPVVLELGGKDAFIVCHDANLNQVCRVISLGLQPRNLPC